MPESSSFSPASITAIAQVVSGGTGMPRPGDKRYGKYRNENQLKTFFSGFGVDFVLQPAKSRVPTTEACLAAIQETPEGDDLIRKIIEAAVHPADYLDLDDSVWEEAVAYLNRVLRFDGYQLQEVRGVPRLTRSGGVVGLADRADELAEELGFDSMQVEIERIQKHLFDDPASALTAACSALEAVCRKILISINEDIPAKKDLSTLFARVAVHLRLSPSREDLPPVIQDDIKRILGGLQTVANGIAALRTHGGSAHGRESKTSAIDSRIAELAVNACCTLSIFLIQTWQRNHSDISE